MRLIIMITAFLASSCAVSDTPSNKEIHNNLLRYISQDPDCLEDFDDPSFPLIKENELIKLHQLKDGRKLILALCQPGPYQNYFMSFISDDLKLKDATPLSYFLPSSEGDSWNLVPRKIIANPQINDGTLSIFNKYSGSAACGFEAKFDVSELDTDASNKPASLNGELDCGAGRGPDKWPEIKFD